MFGGVPLFRQWKKDFATLTRNAALNSRLKRGIAAFQLKKQHSAALHLEHPTLNFVLQKPIIIKSASEKMDGHSIVL